MSLLDNKKIRVILFITLIALIFAAGVFCYIMYRPHRDVQRETPVEVTAIGLVDLYQIDESSANLRFLDKAVQVKGVVAEVEINQAGQIVLILAGSDPLSGVRCTLRENKKVLPGAQITLKGKCSGYLSDVILIDCVIVD